MELWQSVLGWASDAATSNAVRTIVALLAIPGALWGAYLFWRWLNGEGMDSHIREMRKELKTIRIEKSNGEYVEFSQVELNQVLDIIHSKRYQLDGHYDASLEAIIRLAMGPILADVKGSKDYNFKDAISRFALNLGNQHCKLDELVEEDKKTSSISVGPLAMAIFGLIEQVRTDLLSLNLIIERKELVVSGGHGEKVIIRTTALTNLGKAAIRILLARHVSALKSRV